MAEPGEHAEQLIAELARAYEAAATHVGAIENAEEAFQLSGVLDDVLYRARTANSRLRGRLALRIQQERKLKLDELGAHLGISKSRAGQLTMLGRTADKAADEADPTASNR
jgi:hypothetical protein